MWITTTLLETFLQLSASVSQLVTMKWMGRAAYVTFYVHFKKIVIIGLGFNFLRNVRENTMNALWALLKSLWINSSDINAIVWNIYTYKNINDIVVNIITCNLSIREVQIAYWNFPIIQYAAVYKHLGNADEAYKVLMEKSHCIKLILHIVSFSLLQCFLQTGVKMMHFSRATNPDIDYEFV